MNERTTMQTFLPEPSFSRSAASLDRQRLGKQRVETLQILNTLTGVSDGWKHHPAVKMWRGHEAALAQYGIIVCMRWAVVLGYKDSCLDKIRALVPEAEHSDAPMPPWFGDDALHLSHRSNLVRKNPDHYRPLWPSVPDDLPYVWPVN